MIAYELHQKALNAAERYTRAESDLIEILQQIDECKGYRNLGWKSLFEYIQLEISEELQQLLTRAQELLSQKQSRSVPLEETLRGITENYIERQSLWEV